jgi:hypothetical protein
MTPLIQSPFAIIIATSICAGVDAQAAEVSRTSDRHVKSDSSRPQQTQAMEVIKLLMHRLTDLADEERVCLHDYRTVREAEIQHNKEMQDNFLLFDEGSTDSFQKWLTDQNTQLKERMRMIHEERTRMVKELDAYLQQLLQLRRAESLATTDHP